MNANQPRSLSRAAADCDSALKNHTSKNIVDKKDVIKARKRLINKFLTRDWIAGDFTLDSSLDETVATVDHIKDYVS